MLNKLFIVVGLSAVTFAQSLNGMIYHNAALHKTYMAVNFLDMAITGQTIQLIW
jgi:hypothetical protein